MVLYEDRHRHDGTCGTTSYRGNNSYVIRIFSEKNFEEIRDKMDVEFRDPLLHEAQINSIQYIYKVKYTYIRFIYMHIL